jgi:16S rRNA (cytidine1402-2'-O)-methyltransferase
MPAPGKLFLIPSTLGDGSPEQVLPAAALAALRALDTFIVEDARTARAFLKAAGHPRPLREIALGACNEHTRPRELPALLAPLLAGKDCGLLSEAGCPGVADPGAALVRLAHERDMRVVPLVGPSSILLALMASGLEGQRFAFHGYLPVEAAPRRERLLALERDSMRARRTEIFIEAPYRNERLLQAVLDTCEGDTLLCIATDLTLETEFIRTRAVHAWRQGERPRIDRRPTVFLLHRARGGEARRPVTGC